MSSPAIYASARQQTEVVKFELVRRRGEGHGDCLVSAQAKRQYDSQNIAGHEWLTITRAMPATTRRKHVENESVGTVIDARLTRMPQVVSYRRVVRAPVKHR